MYKSESSKFSGNPECVKKLLKNGADFHFKDDRNKTALDYAEIGGVGAPDVLAKALGLDYKGVIELLEDAETWNTTGKITIEPNQIWNSHSFLFYVLFSSFEIKSTLWPRKLTLFLNYNRIMNIGKII